MVQFASSRLFGRHIDPFNDFDYTLPGVEEYLEEEAYEKTLPSSLARADTWYALLHDPALLRKRMGVSPVSLRIIEERLASIECKETLGAARQDTEEEQFLCAAAGAFARWTESLLKDGKLCAAQLSKGIPAARDSACKPADQKLLMLDMLLALSEKANKAGIGGGRKRDAVIFAIIESFPDNLSSSGMNRLEQDRRTVADVASVVGHWAGRIAAARGSMSRILKNSIKGDPRVRPREADQESA